MALNDKQRRFVEEYLVDLNATQAAIRAGYSDKTAYSQGQRLLKDAEIAQAIRDAQNKRSKRTEITADKVLKELAKIGFSDIRRVVNWRANVTGMQIDEETGEERLAITNEVALVSADDLDDDAAACIAEISQTDRGGLKVKLYDKRAALVDIGKHLGMFVERHEHSGKDGGPIETVMHDADTFASRIARLSAARSDEGRIGEAEPGDEGGA